MTQSITTASAAFLLSRNASPATSTTRRLPAIVVDIDMAIITPVDAKRPIPVLMSFGNGAMPPNIPPNAPPSGGLAGPITSSQLVVAAGWGYVSINTTSIQVDNGVDSCAASSASSTKAGTQAGRLGIAARVGVGAHAVSITCSHGSAIDKKHVGIEGVSRYGKAALVAAFDSRFQMVLVGSSGEGG